MTFGQRDDTPPALACVVPQAEGMAALARRSIHLLRARPAFARLWLGGVITQLGDWVGWVAVSMFTLHAGGGALDLALVFSAHSLPTLLTLPLAGRLLDRFDRRKALVITSVVCGAITVGMAAAAWAQSLVVLQTLLVVRSMAQAFVAPAERAAVPALVERDELLLAGAFEASSWSVIFSGGMVLGGALTLLGAPLALALDGFSFIAAALMFARLPPLPPNPSSSESDEPAPAVPSRELRFATYAKAPLALAAGAAWVVVALRVDGWAAAGLAFGWIHASRGVGAGVGSVLAARLGHARWGWPLAMLIGALGFIALASFESPWVTALAAAGWGIGSGSNWVFSSEAQQRLSASDRLARVAATDTWSWTLAMCLGAILVGVLADAQVRPASVLAVVAALGITAWSGGWLWSNARQEKMTQG